MAYHCQQKRSYTIIVINYNKRYLITIDGRTLPAVRLFRDGASSATKGSERPTCCDRGIDNDSVAWSTVTDMQTETEGGHRDADANGQLMTRSASAFMIHVRQSEK